MCDTVYRGVGAGERQSDICLVLQLPTLLFLFFAPLQSLKELEALLSDTV